ncbi:MAG: MFS transporter [Burkholderia sp.]
MTASHERGKLRRVIVSTVVGGTFEWFDFLVYAYFSSTIAHECFAGIAHGGSLLLTFVNFALGFLVRPIGGVVMGALRRWCRAREGAVLDMVAMSAGSQLPALTPGYATLGVFASLLVLAGRLVQGFAVGSQFALSSVTVYEVAPAGRRMFYGSFNMVAMAVAVMLSSGISYLLTEHLSHQALGSWGWRVPFLLGALVGPVGFWLRHHVDESDTFRRMQARPVARLKAPARVRAFLRGNGDAVLCAMGVMMVGTSLNYVWHVYLPTYAQQLLHLSLSSSLHGVCATSIVGCLLSPVFGLLADRIGADRLFCWFIAAWALSVFPLFWFLL